MKMTTETSETENRKWQSETHEAKARLSEKVNRYISSKTH